ncbi:hypothetical protein CQW29_04175 [Pantoea coffeiphila]|uniref:Uncharacterized protein n=1 Tax=Pantoea coffeiphila TaxID=1465635 RepID=A0A2S9IGF4_9GAMM|nr:hypothetical protein CQW29_04175 [Pantoea coffeiphila]
MARAGRPLQAGPEGTKPQPKAPQSGARTARKPQRPGLNHQSTQQHSNTVPAPPLSHAKKTAIPKRDSGFKLH